MRNLIPTLLTVLTLLITVPGMSLAQSEGDFRSVAKGDWSAAATWEVFQGGSWAAAVTAPTGSETITVAGDSVFVDVAVAVTGKVIAETDGVLEVGAGTITFADGSTYEHARDEGSVPEATWASGSTALFTGLETDTPDNRGQDYHHLTLNIPGLLGNEDFSLGGHTIGGNLHVIDSGSARIRLIGGSDGTITIMGDVIVEADGQLETQGTGSPTTVVVNHWGDLIVNGGVFSVSRGSQGSGTGTTTWNMLSGDLTMTDGQTRNSNPTPGNAKLVFAAAGTQTVTFSNVEYAGGDVHFAVSDSTVLEAADGFEVNGRFENRGEVTALGSMTFLDGSVYVHARDEGSVPSATWAEGSTALFTGIETNAPGNRGQDYYNLTLDTPGLLSNRDLSLGGATIGGDLHVIDSGGSRWRLIGGSDGTITIMGDVIVEADAQLETQGTGSPTNVIVNHHGSIVVNGGALSVSRGSQGSGTGTTTWNLLGGDMTLTDADSRNSNPTPGNAKFVFAGTGTQTLTIAGSSDDIDDLSIQVASGATLSLGTSVIVGDGIFQVEAGGTVETAHEAGLDGALQLTGDGVSSFDVDSGLTFNGEVAQVVGAATPDTLGTLTFANMVGATLADTTSARVLVVAEGSTFMADTTGSVLVAGGTVDGTIVNRGHVATTDGNVLTFGASATYEHDRDGGTVPSGTWAEGSTFMITGTVSEAPDNRNQDYHHVTFNAPNQISNLHLNMNGNTIGGDVHVVSTGLARWYLMSASATESASVTVMGDVIVEDGQFAAQGTGNALTTFTVDHHGSILVTGGNLSIGRGSQGNGSGTTTWTLHEGDFSMANAKTQNSNSVEGNAKFVFAADGTQSLTLTDVEVSNLSIEVNSGTTLDVGGSEVGGSGLFMVNAGGSVATAHVDGIAGNLQTSGTVSLSEEANFVFNGTSAQVTSTLMPATVNDLTIDNEAGVELSQATQVNGVLLLSAGVFNNTIPFTLGVGGSVSFDGGSLLVNVANENEVGSEIPTEFALHGNYPNPFNPSTTIRYDIAEQSNVSVTVHDVLGRMITQVVNERQAPGTYSVQWNAAGMASGTYYYRIEAGSWSATRSLLLIK